MRKRPVRPRKRSLSAHQKQIKFFAVLAGAILVTAALALLWLLNSPYLARR